MALLAAVGIAVASCGSGSAPSPTRTASITRVPSHSATASAPPVQSSTPTAATQTTGIAAPRPTGAASTAPASQAAQEDASGTPGWLWWLLAALAVVLAAAIAWLIARRSRRTRWTRELSAAADEVAWFARVLLPQLGRVRSVEQIIGGWQVAAPQIVALEDRLTQLEATAPATDYAVRARMVRDAVRSSRFRMSGLSASADRIAAGEAMAGSAAELEAALARLTPTGQQPRLGGPVAGPDGQPLSGNGRPDGPTRPGV